MKTPFHSALSLLVFLLSAIATYALAPTGLKFRVPCTRWSVPISHCWVPWLATLLLLIFQALTPKDVATALVGDDNIRPPTIIVTYLSLAYLAISCELTGLYSWLALHIARRTHRNPLWQLFAFFGLSGALTAATSPDISLVALTPIMAYTAAASNMDPMALAATHMGASSVCGLMVAVSGPMNIIAAQAFGLTLMRFALWMTLPALAAAAIMFGALFLLLHRRRLGAVRHSASAATARPPYPDPVLVLHDQVGAAWCAAALCGCLLALAVAPSLRWRQWVVAAVFAATAAIYNGLAATAAVWGPLGAVIGRRSAYERRQQLQAEMVALGLHPALTDEDLADLLLSAAQRRSTSLTRLAAATADRLTNHPTAAAVASVPHHSILSPPPPVRHSAPGVGGEVTSHWRRQFSASGVGFTTPSRSGSFSFSVASGTGSGGGGVSLAAGPVRQWFSRRWSSLRGWTVPVAVSGELIEAATDAGADLRILGEAGTAGAGGATETNVRHHQPSGTHLRTDGATVSSRSGGGAGDDTECQMSEELKQLLTRGTSAAPDALEWWAAVAYSAQELFLRRGSRGPSAHRPTGQCDGSSLASLPPSLPPPSDGLAPDPSTVPLMLAPDGRCGQQPSALGLGPAADRDDVAPLGGLMVPGPLTRRSAFAAAAAAATVAAATGGCELLAGPIPTRRGCGDAPGPEGTPAGGTRPSTEAGDGGRGCNNPLATTPTSTTLTKPAPTPPLPLPQPASSSSWTSALSPNPTKPHPAHEAGHRRQSSLHGVPSEPPPHHLSQLHSQSNVGGSAGYSNPSTTPPLRKFGAPTLTTGGGSGSVVLPSPLGPRREPSGPQPHAAAVYGHRDAGTLQPAPLLSSPPAAGAVKEATGRRARPDAPSVSSRLPFVSWRREAAATETAACPTEDEAVALLPSRGPDGVDDGGRFGDTSSGDGGAADPCDVHLHHQTPPSRSFKTEGILRVPPPPPPPPPPPGGSGALITVSAVATSPLHTSSSLGYGSGGTGSLSGRLTASSSYGVEALIRLGSGGGGRSGGGRCGAVSVSADGVAGRGGCAGGAGSCGAPQRHRAPSLTLLLLASNEISLLGTLAALPWSQAVLLAGSCVMTEALEIHGWIDTLTSFLNVLAGASTPSPSTTTLAFSTPATHSHLLPLPTPASLPPTSSSPGLVASVVFALGSLTAIISLVITGQTATLILIRALNRPTFLTTARSPLPGGTTISTIRATTSPGGFGGALRGAQLAVVLGANLAPALALSGSLTALRWGLGLRQLGLRLRCGRYLAGGLVPAAVAAGMVALVVVWGQCAAGGQ